MAEALFDGTVPDIVFHYFGPVQQPNTTLLRDCLCEAANKNCTVVDVLFCSGGGNVDDGLALYALIRAMPFRLRFHVIGQISSVAIPVFLASDSRSCDPNGSFMFHEYDWTYPSAITLLESRMAEHLSNLRNAVARAKAVISSRAAIPGGADEIDRLFKAEHTLNPTEATRFGLVSKVFEYRVPDGVQVINLRPG